MVAKLIAWGTDREQTRVRMLAALDEFRLIGPATTIPFHKALLRHPEFIKGNLSTHFLAEHMPTLEARPSAEAVRYAALIAALEGDRGGPSPGSPGPAEADNVWRRAGRWAAVGIGR
jgi:pyruvate carboxylase subunit A